MKLVKLVGSVSLCILPESQRLRNCFGNKVAKVHLSDSLCHLILPDVVQPRASLEVCAGCVLLEVVSLATIAQIAQRVRHEGCAGTSF